MDFAAAVMGWYGEHKRDLPWRQTKDPYKIWLSEVILQQTRVEQGLPYFYNFSEKYPTVADLAAADEDEILKMWQGLGYYSRGRNMHHTAGVVMDVHKGAFPVSYKELIRLKGVGEYTAAAISSFASGEPKPVVDGNVFRLLSRFFGIGEAIDTLKGKRLFTALAGDLIDRDHPAIFNQAVMEFGSLQCRPRNPDCSACPLRPECEAYRTGRVNEFPVKSKKQQVKVRFFNYFVLNRGGKLLLNKRGGGDIWQHLHEFPLIETPAAADPQELIRQSVFTRLFGDKAVVKKISGPVTHVLSHQKLNVVFIELELPDDEEPLVPGWFYAGPGDLERLAQPKLIFAFLKNYPDFHSHQL